MGEGKMADDWRARDGEVSKEGQSIPHRVLSRTSHAVVVSRSPAQWDSKGRKG
jgi:hypothetical protein